MLASATAGLLLLTAACGAGGSGSSAPARDGSGGGTLTVLVEAGGHGELTPIADKCQPEIGATVNFVELPYDGLLNRLKHRVRLRINDFRRGRVGCDLALDVCGRPATMFTDSVKADLFPATVAEAQVGGHYLGMPQWTNSEVLLYRKDLFADPTEQANFKAKYGYALAPPTTWRSSTTSRSALPGRPPCTEQTSREQSLQLVQRSRSPTASLRHRHGYAVDLHHGLPADIKRSTQEFPTSPNTTAGGTHRIRPIHQPRQAGTTLRDVER